MELSTAGVPKFRRLDIRSTCDGIRKQFLKKKFFTVKLENACCRKLGKYRKIKKNTKK